MGFVLSRKGIQEKSRECHFGSWDEGEDDTPSLTHSIYLVLEARDSVAQWVAP